MSIALDTPTEESPKAEFDAEFDVEADDGLDQEPAQACYIDPWTDNCTYLPGD